MERANALEEIANNLSLATANLKQAAEGIDEIIKFIEEL